MAVQIVEKALQEIQEDLSLLDLGTNLLNSMIVFVVLFLVTTLFNQSTYFALIPSVIYLAFTLGKSFNKNRYRLVEEKVPELRYQLTTVADNKYKVNPIIDSLREDVVRNVHKVRAADFIDTNTVAMKVLLLAIFSVIVVIISYYNVDLDFNLDVGGLGGEFTAPRVRYAGQNVSNVNLTYLEGNLSDIFGEGSIAQLGVRELELTINPLASDADVRNLRNVRDHDFTPPSFPKEIYTSYDVAYEEKIARENQRVVRDYFERITR